MFTAANNRKLPIPTPNSVQDTLLWYCDFNSLARQKHLKVLLLQPQRSEFDSHVRHFVFVA